ncbi:MAG: 4Fe-4S dicluster domain-containing protein [Pseudomonadota bacterium]|nr:4Fe-4S dicluster domain-containing protein [Pseudomonadota bacterium]
MATIEKQVRMVFDLNKCIGCHTCTMACKTQWTDGRIDIPLENLPDNPEGLLYQYWNNVETMPGRGYPRGVFTPELGGGFTNPTDPDDWRVDPLGPLPGIVEDYGAPWEYNYDEVLGSSAVDEPPGTFPVGDTFAATESQMVPIPSPDGPDAYSSNWDEDVGAGKYPNTHYFYLPRLCNHCTKPACLAACPKNAIYKREEDGVVLIDQDRCEGYRRCVAACPYKKVYYNAAKKKSQKCIFCYPRIEQDTGPDNLQPPRENFCFNQCVGRIRFAGFYDPDLGPNAAENLAKNVNQLVDVWGVALRLHPEFGTAPNLFYIPPLSPPGFRRNGRLVPNSQRIPIKLLAKMFGDDANQTLRQRMRRIKEIFRILETERAKVANGGSSALVDILVAREESDRLQLYLG